MNFDPFDNGPCGQCGLRPMLRAGDGTREGEGDANWNEYGGIDPCLPGFIPGVSAACCGHGVLGRAYVQLGGVVNESRRDGILTLRGQLALDFFDTVRESRRHGPDGCPDDCKLHV